MNIFYHTLYNKYNVTLTKKQKRFYVGYMRLPISIIFYAKKKKKRRENLQRVTYTTKYILWRYVVSTIDSACTCEAFMADLAWFSCLTTRMCRWVSVRSKTMVSARLGWGGGGDDDGVETGRNACRRFNRDADEDAEEDDGAGDEAAAPS